jgi:uroporphyrin-3 C-methyltransferase
MPTDGDRPDEESFDPLAQPPLRRSSAPRPSSTDSSTAPDEGSSSSVDDETPGEAGQERPQVAKPRGRFLGFLGVLFGLAGMAAAGYLYYLLVYLDPEAHVDARITALQTELDERSAALEEQKRSQAQALDDLAASEKKAREALTDRLLEAVNTAAAQAPPSTREWKIAEVAYLLRIANHRVLMERDVAGALVLLKAADAILEELDDFGLYQVRARLADEILALENFHGNDLQGLFLRMEAVKTELGRQEVKLPRFEKSESESTPAAEGFWSALTRQLGSYLRFRRFSGEGIKPLLAPEESVYLELNLRLMLERAQLAALKRDQVVYEQSLQTAADWISTYLDTSSPGVQKSLEELDALSDVVLDRPLPDISGSLNALKAARALDESEKS